ncbi:MAG: ribonuclease III [Candidatus Schekmanbacteria bacterium]|nr:ribonuclease III [Candidatus Schekmanbacteria bacterium]
MDYSAFEKRISYKFSKPALLKKALTHLSGRVKASNRKSAIRENQKLEFIGDAVLELTIREHATKKHRNATLGEISRYKTQLVSDHTLAKLARRIRLDEYITAGNGADHQSIKKSDTILAASLEALIGGIFLDSGIPEAKKFIIYKVIIPFGKLRHSLNEDYKSIFQEKYQKIYKKPPVYKIIKESGPAHDKTFVAEVRSPHRILGRGKGKNKKEAHQMAAKEALAALNEK